MPNYNITPNMSLIVPVVGTDPGPDYATNINNSLNILDSHNHSPGSGVQITPTGLNINSTLTMQNQPLINAAYVSLTSLVSTPSPVGSVYRLGSDLYFVNGAGTNIQITNSSGVAGTPGSIGNLTSPASVFYVSANSTYDFWSAPNTTANLSIASLSLSNLVANANSVTLSPPVTISAPYTLILPNLPGQKNIMTLDASGNIGASLNVDNSTLQYVGNTLSVAPGGITTTQIASATIVSGNIAASTIVGSNIASATIVGANIASNTIGSANLTVPPSGRTGFATSANNGPPFLITSVVVACSGTKDVFFSGNGGAAATLVLAGGTGIIYMQMDGVTVSSYTLTPGTFYPPSAFIGYAPGVTAGNHTFSIAGESTVGQAINWVSTGMYAFEIR